MGNNSKHTEGNTVSDLMFLFGYKPKPARFGSRFDSIKIEAENAWLEGKNADANPYNKNNQPLEYNTWYAAWLNCNKNA